MVGLGDVLRARYPTAYGWGSMVLVALGCLLVPLKSIHDLRLSHYFNRSTLWIVLTALGTVGYSMLDKFGTESIPIGPAQSAVYGYIFFLVAATVYWALRRLSPVQPQSSSDPGWRLPAVAAILNYGSYWLVLWSYQLTERASYVVAFRQFSIVIGVVAAFVIFNEPGRRVRTAGALVITAGLVVLVLLGG